MVGFIGTADPYRDNWLKVFSALADEAGIKVAAAERFPRQDPPHRPEPAAWRLGVSVTGSGTCHWAGAMRWLRPMPWPC
jgi:hypothetical protein